MNNRGLKMNIYTSKSGAILREYVRNIDLKSSRVAIFPEHGLDANEQAQWLKENRELYDEVYTLSPFILSDSKEVILISSSLEANHSSGIKFGDSVNKVTMKLWRGCTVGDIAKEQIERIRETCATEEEAYDAADHLGDSVEKVLMFSCFQQKENDTRAIGEHQPAKRKSSF